MITDDEKTTYNQKTNISAHKQKVERIFCGRKSEKSS